MSTPAGEITLPGMPADEPLWAVRIHLRTNPGSKVIAKASRVAAEKDAAGANRWLEAVGKRPDFAAKVAAGLITWTSAEVVPWPYLRETHARALAEQEADQ